MATTAKKIRAAKANQQRWSTTELADYIGITPTRVKQIRDDGRIPSSKFKHGVWTYEAYPKIVRANSGRPGPLADYIEEREELEGERSTS